MEDNKNLEVQGQQNQDPDNKPEEKEPTVEELMAQLAQERANSAKLQNDYNKASSEAANYRKQLKAKQTAEEQEEEAKKEARDEALAEGRAEGLKEGRSEGLKEGKAEGVKQSKIDIAKAMLKENCVIELIAKVTDLSIKEIEKLKEELN